MTTIAVTGGIGAGKSTVSRLLAERGAIVIDSDELAREVVAPDTAGLRAVVAEFGPQVLLDDGSLNRAVLAEIVFADEEARESLEAITHPMIRAEFDRRLLAARAAHPGAVIVNDIPLVRTALDAGRYDAVVTVVAEVDRRIDRLIQRGLSAADARARIAAQISDDERISLADIVITNNGPESELRAEVDELWKRISSPTFARR